MIDLSKTIAPKSDQLNADDLITGPVTILVTKVARGETPEQPISISYEGDAGKPWKPCKGMRRVLVQVWGKDGSAYVGRRLTLYRDDKVTFGGAEVGGIRISHMSHITEPVTLAVTVSKTNRKPFRVLPLPAEAPAQGAAPAEAPGIDVILADLQGHEEASLAKLRGMGWLSDTQTLADLNPKQRTSIHAGLDRFIRSLTKTTTPTE